MRSLERGKKGGEVTEINSVNFRMTITSQFLDAMMPNRRGL